MHLSFSCRPHWNATPLEMCSILGVYPCSYLFKAVFYIRGIFLLEVRAKRTIFILSNTSLRCVLCVGYIHRGTCFSVRDFPPRGSFYAGAFLYWVGATQWEYLAMRMHLQEECHTGCMFVLGEASHYAEGLSFDSDCKESACSAGDRHLIPGLGGSPGGSMATDSSILAWRIP